MIQCLFTQYILPSLPPPLQLVTSRHHLMLSCQQTASLHDIYQRQSVQLEQEDSRPFLFFVPMTRKKH